MKPVTAPTRPTRSASAAGGRARLITLIHVAKRDLQMDDPTYRTMLRTAGKADSTAKMGVPALMKVLEHAKKAGFKVRSKAGDRPQATPTEARKVRALWLFLHHLGAVQDPTESALAAYVKRIAKVDDLRWARDDQMLALIESLKKWAMRFLPAAIAGLRAEAAALAARGALTAEQLGQCQRAHNEVSGGGLTFDRHWAAWEAYAAVVGGTRATSIKANIGGAP
ncbi:gp16 family protein [Variovorax boronicumulans]|uniref:gp16 family protein n=1 Tax=Variovorax boronicumulans TaxID=436515 RepID=UPI001C588483